MDGSGVNLYRTRHRAVGRTSRHDCMSDFVRGKVEALADAAEPMHRASLCPLCTLLPCHPAGATWCLGKCYCSACGGGNSSDMLCVTAGVEDNVSVSFSKTKSMVSFLNQERSCEVRSSILRRMATHSSRKFSSSTNGETNRALCSVAPVTAGCAQVLSMLANHHR